MANSSPSSAKQSRGKNGGADARGAADAQPVPPVRTAAPTGAAPARLSPDQIARRAYEIYEREGRQPGRELENWLRAEAELTAESSTRH